MRATKIWMRLLVLTVALVGPVVVLGYMLASESSVNIEFSEAEVRGVEYHTPAWDVLRKLAEHRTLAAMVVAGNAARREAMLAKEREVDAALAKLFETDARLGAEMHTTELLKGVEGGWTAIKGRLAQPGSMDLQAFMTEHNHLVYDMGRVITKMGNHSNLILDPDIDTYYLMDATQFKLPRLFDQLTQIQAIGAAAQSRPADLEVFTPLERAEIANASIRADEYLHEGLTNLQYSFDANPGIQASLGGSTQVMRSAITEALADTNRKLSSPNPVGADAWVASLDKAIAPTAAMFDTTLANLDQYIDARISRLSSRRTMHLGFAAFVALAALALNGAISQSIVSPIDRLRSVADKISLGELEAKIDTSGGDEVAELAKTVVRMQESLRIAAREAGEL